MKPARSFRRSYLIKTPPRHIRRGEFEKQRLPTVSLDYPGAGVLVQRFLPYARLLVTPFLSGCNDSLQQARRRFSRSASLNQRHPMLPNAVSRWGARLHPRFFENLPLTPPTQTPPFFVGWTTNSNFPRPHRLETDIYTGWRFTRSARAAPETYPAPIGGPNDRAPPEQTVLTHLPHLQTPIREHVRWDARPDRCLYELLWSGAVLGLRGSERDSTNGDRRREWF